mmetsp:Transcript_7631/g.12835  ORF Transcript_7631/g.12835 Transcript_7631/m.12835 type:complete len:139 (+) Transcript_7631:531-947(+)
MCKYSVFNHKELDSPIASFVLGLFVFFTNIFCGITNMLCSMSQKRSEAVIKNYIAYLLLVKLTFFYTKQRTSFPLIRAVIFNPIRVKNDVGELFNENPPLSVKVMYYIHKVLRAMYASIYFYFFPMFVIYLPMQRLLF